MSKFLTLISGLLLLALIIGKEYKPTYSNKVEINNWTVTLTTYTISVTQTDSTPLITASGFKLDSINPARHRIIAMSRDLKQRFRFGSKVKLSNAGRFNGVYYVRDVMNKRFRNKIDILINPNGKHTKLENVILSKI